MSLIFPSSPTLNQIFTSNNRSWKWDGVKWVLVVASVLESSLGNITHTTSNTSTNIAANEWLTITAAGQEVTLPDPVNENTICYISVGDFTNTDIDPGSNTIKNQSGVHTLDSTWSTTGFIFKGGTWRPFRGGVVGTPGNYNHTTTAVNKTIAHLEWLTVTASSTEIDLPTDPAENTICYISVENFEDTIVDPGTKPINGINQPRILNLAWSSTGFIYKSNNWRSL